MARIYKPYPYSSKRKEVRVIEAKKGETRQETPIVFTTISEKKVERKKGPLDDIQDFDEMRKVV